MSWCGGRKGYSQDRGSNIKNARKNNRMERLSADADLSPRLSAQKPQHETPRMGRYAKGDGSSRFKTIKTNNINWL